MNKFKIALEARMRHGILREALVQRGWNQRQAAEFLGIRQEVFGRWVNLKEFPKNISAELVIKLFELTGKMPEEIWPEEIFTEEFLAKPKKAEAIRDVPTERLLAQAGVYALLPSPDESFARQELKTVVDEALQKLTPRQERIIRQMFEDDASLAEIAAGFGVPAERIRQFKDKALCRLRDPEIARRLRPFTA